MYVENDKLNNVVLKLDVELSVNVVLFENVFVILLLMLKIELLVILFSGNVFVLIIEVNKIMDVVMSIFFNNVIIKVFFVKC